MVQVLFDHGKFNVYVFDEDEELRVFYEEEEEDKWLIQNEFVDITFHSKYPHLGRSGYVDLICSQGVV